MAVKKMLRIFTSENDQIGEYFDLWEFRSIQRSERYNETKGEMEYLILVNKNAIATNYNDLEIVCDSEEFRDNEILRIRDVMEEDENIVIM